MKTLVEVYRSKRKEGAYLFVEKGYDKTTLPETLTYQLGPLTLSMTMVLTPEKKLARADASLVLQAIQLNGFYLQMPPQANTYMAFIPNDKLPISSR